jgi:hypothetical protein
VVNGIEGSEKVIKGGEYEPIKISQGNLIYILNSIQHVSTLAWSRPHSYKKTIDYWN